MCQIDSLTRIFESTQQPLSISWGAEATLEKLPWRSLRAGDVLVWVGIVHARKVKWKELRRRGVYTVYYQTEPMARVGRKVGVEEATTGTVDADAIWDYSKANMDHIDGARGRRFSAFVPITNQESCPPCCAKPCGPPPRLALPPPSASMEDGCTALSFLMSFSLHPHQPCPR